MRRTERLTVILVTFTLLFSLFNIAIAQLDRITPDDNRPFKVYDGDQSGFPSKGDDSSDDNKDNGDTSDNDDSSEDGNGDDDNPADDTGGDGGASDNNGDTSDESSEGTVDDGNSDSSNDEQDQDDSNSENNAEEGQGNAQSQDNSDQQTQTSSHSNGGSSGSSSNSQTIPNQNKEETKESETAPEISETDNETNESSFTDILDSFYRIPDDDPSDNHYYTRSHYATMDDDRSEGINPLYYVLVIAILIISYFVAIELQNRLKKNDTESKEVESIDVKRISKREEIIYIPKKKTVSEFFEQ